MKVIMLYLLLAVSVSLTAQVPADYFQQKVEYDMDVKLIDALHELSGTVDITYTNQSPNTLDQIYLHLWPNAYKNRSTALAKQLVENGNTRFHFAEIEDLGGYREIDIRINDKVVQWDYWEGHRDVALIYLSEPLAPGASLEINTRFELDIPASHSRLGHIDQSYQMTQWYPKPAVYDRDGWHPMPYLDQGEFYSEFGDFNVRITLPKNYVVGATGVLQTATEIDFLAEKIQATQERITAGDFEETDTIPTSSTENKTIVYKAENVHDFAWFADKRFHVNKSQVTLASGRVVDTYIMFTNQQADLWADAIDYVNRSVEFYSTKVGEYPYPHATAVQAIGSAGAGMEYPMITVIGSEDSEQALDEVITHEVGHNWFMGILATNERDYAWLDEGFNSFYEKEYIYTYYEASEVYDDFSAFSNLPNRQLNQLSFYIPMRRHTDQPINTPSDELTSYNYWEASYDKPAYVLNYLKNYIGADQFDAMMQTYFEEWKFKHPQPEDVRRVFERETQKDLSWLFDDLINTTKPLDYKMKKIQKEGGNYEITIVNKGEVAAPFPIDVVLGDEIESTVWVEGFQGEKTVTVAATDPDRFVIDANYMMPDLYRNNNTIRPKGGKIEPLEFRLLGGAEDPEHTSVYYSPIMGGNVYDGFMLGAIFFNTVTPNKRFEWNLAPMYAFRSKSLVGVADAKYHWYPKGVQQVTLGADYRGFHYDNNTFYSDSLGANSRFDYHRITPRLTVELNKKRARSKLTHTFMLEVPVLGREVPGTIGVDGNGNFLPYDGHKYDWDVVPRLKYLMQNRRSVSPYSIGVQLEQFSEAGDNYLKLSLETENRFDYATKKGLHLRTFGGFFLTNTKRDVDSFRKGSLSLFSTGRNDPWNDGLYFARSESSGFLSRQVNGNLAGGFKFPMNADNTTGVSNIFIVAVNAELDLPMQLPAFFPNIKPYLDMGYYHQDNFTALSDGFLLDAGVAIEIGDVLGVYLPLLQNKSLRDLRPDSFGARVSFQMDLDVMNNNANVNNVGL